ncbi:hypothetical protein AXK56_13160 [Tsukamurella pulmonis]|uniref:DUF4190 domain-containing protein n=1 Tax=Tsukamurella pulmonis TaxID=47312 RepID=A0A1H1GSI2_9ACTN|nr:DUF4190 domain-containing protein [Tsukamurella pulmonis]KXO88296.1 hypothetical protein AXK56_13160 [Tsukamurella pulmonis]SDR15806.1 hypothetical protein SAMN04489765_3518 [Tsukamurella pulmonis]SUP16784.1 Uncharacterised protein [Tsukamurella pulmonis]
MSMPSDHRPPGQERFPYGGTTPQGYGPPMPAGERVNDPDNTLAITGVVLSFFCALPGLIVSIVALNKSKRRGYKNTVAVVGVVLGGVLTAFAVLYLIFAVIVGVSAAASDPYSAVALLR